MSSSIEPGTAGQRSADDTLESATVLEVRLPAETSGDVFEPERVRLPVIDENCLPGTVIVDRPWTGPAGFRICAGDIQLRDRDWRTVEAMSFGADVTVREDLGDTVCTISSKAPILQLLPGSAADPDGTRTRLATEVAALLARRRAHWAPDEETYVRRLAAADARELYMAALDAVRDRLAALPSTCQDDTERSLRRLIDRSLAAAGPRPPYAARWSTLDEIL